MTYRFSLTDYISRAMAQAEYEKLEDGSYFGKIPACLGCIAFGQSLKRCEEELQSVLEDWILVGFHLGHTLPVIDGIDLNPKTKSGRRRSVSRVYEAV
jgi:predicted RNase H-like HicB family nuclease